MYILLFILYFAAFIYGFSKTKLFVKSGVSVFWLVVLLLVKSLVAYIMLQHYINSGESRHWLDVFKYFDDSSAPIKLLTHKPGEFFRYVFLGRNAVTQQTIDFISANSNHWLMKQNDSFLANNTFFILFNTPLRLLSFNNVYIEILLFNMLSVIGLFALFQFFQLAPSLLNKLIFFFFPAVLVWTSLNFKESALLFFMGMLLYLYDESWKRLSVVRVILVLGFFLAMMFTRPVVAFALGMALVIFKLWKLLAHTSSWKKIIATTFILFFVPIGLKILHVDLGDYLYQKQIGFYEEIERAAPDSEYEIEILQPHAVNLPKVFPSYLYNSLLRPLDFNFSNFQSAFANVCSLLIALFLLFMIYRILTAKVYNPAENIALSLIFILISSIFIGSVPILGAVLRYKSLFLPFLFQLGMKKG